MVSTALKPAWKFAPLRKTGEHVQGRKLEGIVFDVDGTLW